MSSRNAGAAPHTAPSAEGGFDTEAIASGATPTAAGRYGLGGMGGLPVGVTLIAIAVPLCALATCTQ